MPRFVCCERISPKKKIIIDLFDTSWFPLDSQENVLFYWLDQIFIHSTMISHWKIFALDRFFLLVRFLLDVLHLIIGYACRRKRENIFSLLNNAKRKSTDEYGEYRRRTNCYFIVDRWYITCDYSRWLLILWSIEYYGIWFHTIVWRYSGKSPSQFGRFISKLINIKRREI